VASVYALTAMTIAAVLVCAGLIALVILRQPQAAGPPQYAPTPSACVGEPAAPAAAEPKPAMPAPPPAPKPAAVPADPPPGPPERENTGETTNHEPDAALAEQSREKEMERLRASLREYLNARQAPLPSPPTPCAPDPQTSHPPTNSVEQADDAVSTHRPVTVLLWTGVTYRKAKLLSLTTGRVRFQAWNQFGARAEYNLAEVEAVFDADGNYFYGGKKVTKGADYR